MYGTRENVRLVIHVRERNLAPIRNITFAKCQVDCVGNHWNANGHHIWNVLSMALISCTSSWQPVCGCDGKVYSNSCSANYQNGVNYLCGLNPAGGALPGEDCDSGTMGW